MAGACDMFGASHASCPRAPYGNGDRRHRLEAGGAGAAAGRVLLPGGAGRRRRARLLQRQGPRRLLPAEAGCPRRTARQPAARYLRLARRRPARAARPDRLHAGGFRSAGPASTRAAWQASPRTPPPHSTRSPRLRRPAPDGAAARCFPSSLQRRVWRAPPCAGSRASARSRAPPAPPGGYWKCVAGSHECGRGPCSPAC